MATRAVKKRRLSEKYGRHVEQIAAIYVACGEHSVAAAEKVHQELPHLTGLNETTFSRWADHPQWVGALESARQAASLEDELDPNLRGLKFLRWGRDTLAALLGEYETAKTEKHEKERVNLEARIVKLTEAVRAEERHQSDVRDRQARRDMRTFAKHLFDLTSVHLDEAGKRLLLDLTRDPSSLLKGIE